MHTLIAAGAPTQLWDRLARKYENTPLTFRILNRVINSFNAAESSNLKWTKKPEDDMVAQLKRQLRELREQINARDHRPKLQALTGAAEPCSEGICNFAHGNAPCPLKKMKCKQCFQLYGPSHKSYGKCSNVDLQVPQVEIEGKFYPRVPFINPGKGDCLPASSLNPCSRTGIWCAQTVDQHNCNLHILPLTCDKFPPLVPNPAVAAWAKAIQQSSYTPLMRIPSLSTGSRSSESVSGAVSSGVCAGGATDEPSEGCPPPQEACPQEDCHPPPMANAAHSSDPHTMRHKKQPFGIWRSCGPHERTPNGSTIGSIPSVA